MPLTLWQIARLDVPVSIDTRAGADRLAVETVSIAIRLFSTSSHCALEYDHTSTTLRKQWPLLADRKQHSAAHWAGDGSHVIGITQPFPPHPALILWRVVWGAFESSSWYLCCHALRAC